MLYYGEVAIPSGAGVTFALYLGIRFGFSIGHTRTVQQSVHVNFRMCDVTLGIKIIFSKVEWSLKISLRIRIIFTKKVPKHPRGCDQ